MRGSHPITGLTEVSGSVTVGAGADLDERPGCVSPPPTVEITVEPATRLRFDADAEPIGDDDRALRVATKDADPVALLAAVAHHTGDLSILRADLAPDQQQLVLPSAGLSARQRTEARELAAAALGRHRDKPASAPADPARIVPFITGETDDDVQQLLHEELALGGEDRRAPGWHIADVAPCRTIRVGIIGCGMSGIVVAHRLRQVGADVTIFEKNPEVGGTWYENRYPGCRVDVPSHLYSYSFLQTADWPQTFSSQDVLLGYFRAAVERLGLRSCIRFSTEVLAAAFDEAAAVWRIQTRGSNGAVEHEACHLLVSAVGQLNRPSLPDIPGRDQFTGPWFHAARWRHDIDLSGKRVAVVGTGASAAQFIPAVATTAGHTTVYQRTPPWLLPTPNYQTEDPPGLRWVLRHVPGYARWDRAWTFWRTQEGLLPAATVDDTWWAEHRNSVSPVNHHLRGVLEAHLAAEFPDPGLLARVLPDYPPLAKRAIRDDGTYTAALQRHDLELVTDPIAEITTRGIRTVDGVERPADILVYGTGFQASRFLAPMTITGRRGLDLHDQWGGDARAHLGLTVPGFPNLFLLYGPNTNIVANGSIIFFSECGARYITDAVHRLLASGHRSVECRIDAHDAYNHHIDDHNRRMAWGVADVNSWYRNANGRSAQNWPFSLVDYWRRTRHVEPADHRWA